MRFFSFISMFLLVYVHAYNLNDRYLQPFGFVQERMTFTTFFEYLTANGLFRFRIPMLFAISGYLLAMADGKGYWKLIGRRFRTLAIPYFLWSAIGCLIAWGLFNWSFTHNSVANIHMQPTPKNWNDFGWREWRDTILSTNVTYQLWFLRSLFLLNVLYPLLRFCTLRAAPILFSVATLIWLCTPWSPIQLLPQPIQGPFYLLFDGEGMLPFCLGIWLCKRKKNLSAVPRWLSMRLLITVFAVALIAKTIMAFYGNSQNPVPIGIPIWFLYKVVVASGLLIAWFGSSRLVDWCLEQRWFRHVSDQTFMIYALHVPLVTYLLDPVHGLLQSFRYYRITTYLVLPLFISAVAVAAGMLLKAIARPFFGILTGDRGLKPIKIPEPETPIPTLTVVPSEQKPIGT